MKKLPGIKDAQISLLDFAQTEVTKFMRSNARTVRLSGTAFSRSLEMQQDLATPQRSLWIGSWTLSTRCWGPHAARLWRVSTRRSGCGWLCPTALNRP
jgi:hypothetical protein